MISRLFKSAALFLSFNMLLGSGLSCSPKDYTGSVTSLSVGWSAFEQEALLWIAQDQNLFMKNGLDITLREYDTGAGSLAGMISGEVDITVGVTEFPIVRKAFERSAVSIVGVVAKIEQQFLVARRDRGIETTADLKGKSIGTTIGTIAEFYLGRFLELHGISIKGKINWFNLNFTVIFEKSFKKDAPIFRNFICIPVINLICQFI